MKLTQKNIAVLIVLASSLSLISTININFDSNTMEMPNRFNNQIQKTIKTSESVILNPLLIDNSGEQGYTWAEVSVQSWCIGNGSWNDPYLIENVIIIRSNNDSLRTCLEIKNSNVYFIIRNCSFYNSTVGIKLENVLNGALINNSCSSLNYGVLFQNSSNNIFSGNRINNNAINGLNLERCYNNTISSNKANHNGFDGIYLDRSNYNKISGNNANHNDLVGICLDECHNNTLSENVANNNDIGIFLGEVRTMSWLERSYYGDSNNNSVLGNTANNNNITGIFIIGINNNIIGNSVNYNMFNGIRLQWSSNTIISRNFLSSNIENGIFLLRSDNNTISKNILNNSTTGIRLYASENVFIIGNTANYNFYGILLSYSNNITISENIASYNEDIAISLDRSNSNTVLANDINNNVIGIHLFHAHYNYVLNNVFTYNSIDIREEHSEGNIFQINGLPFDLINTLNLTITIIIAIVIVVIGAIIKRKSYLSKKKISIIDKVKTIDSVEHDISNNKVIVIKDLKKFYGNIKAVNGISFDVRRGEIFGLLGPNGAGKTTIIKLLLGLLEPNEGDMNVFGLNPEDDEIRIKNLVGYVSEDLLMFKSLTPRDLFNFIASIRGLDETTTKKLIKDHLESLEVIDYYDHLIATLSHGNKQKIKMITALLHKPNLLILDEPFSGLDAKSVKVVKSVLDFYTQEGGSVLFSTHVLEIAQALCDRIGIINKGKMVGIGTLEELRQLVEKIGANLEEVFLRFTEQEASVNDIIERLRNSFKKTIKI